MDLLMNGLLMAATLFAGGYCWVLARRVRDLKSLDSGLGGAIVTLTRQVELARTTLDEARASSRDTRQDLSQLVARADGAAGQLAHAARRGAGPCRRRPAPAAARRAGRPPRRSPAPRRARGAGRRAPGAEPRRREPAGRRAGARRAGRAASRRGAEAAGAGAGREPAAPAKRPRRRGRRRAARTTSSRR